MTSAWILFFVTSSEFPTCLLPESFPLRLIVNPTLLFHGLTLSDLAEKDLPQNWKNKKYKVKNQNIQCLILFITFTLFSMFIFLKDDCNIVTVIFTQNILVNSFSDITIEKFCLLSIRPLFLFYFCEEQWNHNTWLYNLSVIYTRRQYT